VRIPLQPATRHFRGIPPPSPGGRPPAGTDKDSDGPTTLLFLNGELLRAARTSRRDADVQSDGDRQGRLMLGATVDKQFPFYGASRARVAARRWRGGGGGALAAQGAQLRLVSK
jgi:hypothetical protein